MAEYEPLDDEIDDAPWPTCKELCNLLCTYCSRILAVVQLIFGTGLIIIFSSGLGQGYTEPGFEMLMDLVAILAGCLIQASTILVIAGHTQRLRKLLLIGSIFPCLVCIHCTYIVLSTLDGVGTEQFSKADLPTSRSILFHAMTAWFMALTFIFHCRVAMIVENGEE